MTVNTTSRARQTRAVRLDQADWQWVEFIARQHAVTPSDVMRGAVSDFISRYRQDPQTAAPSVTREP